MAGLARRLAPAAALGGLAVVIVGVADPVIAGRADVPAGSQAGTSTGTTDAGTTASGPAGTRSTGSGPADPATAGAAAGTATTCDAGEAVSGPTVATRWGPVQVAATVAGGQVCEVHAIAWPSGDRRSLKISQYAIPGLDSMASAQGVAFDAVSGATYTSAGYRESLQQLLDSLG
ncbi:MAG: FMN-binding protein [Candidatus Nanopelagicales bacterium]